MRSKLCLFIFLVCCASTVQAQTEFKLSSTVVPEDGLPVTLDVNYKGPAPPKDSPYLVKGNWKVRWGPVADGPAKAVSVDTVAVDAYSQNIVLRVSGAIPDVSDVRGMYWTVLFDPMESVPLLPQIAASSPNPHVQKPPKKNCDSDDPNGRPNFCPPGDTDVPDLKLTGSFLAAGGSKPILAAQLKADLIFSSRIQKFRFYPGITADVEINQNTQPPNNRTRFDPDSITAGLSWTSIIPFDNSLIYGTEIQLQLPKGEFNRTDPSSNIIAGATTKIVFKPLLSKSFYGTLYPVLGFEAGRNLNRPSAIDKVLVDLTQYRGIFRGLLGADAAVGFASADRKSDIFSITASYRVRLPAIDEPFVKTVHQVTTVDLTTRARHWVEVNVNSSPWNWKYLALNAKYQYGDLPPLFSFVDHKFSIGFTLQAIQTFKPKVPSP